MTHLNLTTEAARTHSLVYAHAAAVRICGGAAQWHRPQGDPQLQHDHACVCCFALSRDRLHHAGTLPSWFGELRSLSTLSLGGNTGLTGSLDGFAQALDPVNGIRQFNVSGCGLTGTVPDRLALLSLFTRCATWSKTMTCVIQL